MRLGLKLETDLWHLTCVQVQFRVTALDIDTCTRYSSHVTLLLCESALEE